MLILTTVTYNWVGDNLFALFYCVDFIPFYEPFQRGEVANFLLICNDQVFGAYTVPRIPTFGKVSLFISDLLKFPFNGAQLPKLIFVDLHDDRM